MKRKVLKKLLLIITLTFSIFSNPLLCIGNVKSQASFFTLKVLLYPYSLRSDYVNLIAQQLERIGIDIDLLDYGWWPGDSYLFYDYDMTYVSLSGSMDDPDYTGVYNENGSINLFKYRTEIDFNETLGTGLNEWYMREGLKIMPPNSQERIDHYWAWEQHLMDKLCLMYPTFVPKTYTAHWKSLLGFNMTEGILRSWGKMSWYNTHEGQLNTNEIVIGDAAWSDLNPLFQDDSTSSFISSATLDSLIQYDSDLTVYPHLAKSLTYLNDTHIRIRTREGIKWQEDPDGYFPNEYFDAKDVYFTFYAWKYNSNNQYFYNWIDDIVLVNKTTVDIFIDGDETTLEKEPYARSLTYFSNKILPEHYLNQTQLSDGITPDITHQSWNIYATNCFGTGLFSLSQFVEGIETVLSVFPDCWRLNTSITSDPVLDWENRFGNFSASPDQLRIRIMPYVKEIEEFKQGKIDIIGVTQVPYFREEIVQNENWCIQSDIANHLSFLAFNVQPTNEIIGDLTPCEENVSISKGLAIRKAICYAINKEEINDIVQGGEYKIIHHPIHPKMGIWCNPNIIKYTHNIDLAKYYMNLAGYKLPDYSNGIQIESGTLWIYILSGITYLLIIGVLILGLFLFKRRKKLGGISE